jgi:quercetin dioxygenase-like cupin family protein
MAFLEKHVEKTMLTLVLFMALASATPAADIEQIRLTPDEITAKKGGGAGAGTSGVVGIQTTVLLGDPAKPGLYTIRVRVPANTSIRAHTHRDDRSAVVVSGTWYFGYGSVADDKATKPLPPGSFYTEPGGVAHFALTKSEPVVIYITGFGPTDTVYVNAADDPRNK